MSTEPAVFNRITMSPQELYDRMIEAHRATTEFLAWHSQEVQRWIEDGKPRDPENTRRAAPGYTVFPPMQIVEVESFLEHLRSRIEFIGQSYDATIVVTYDDFVKWTTPKAKLNG